MKRLAATLQLDMRLQARNKLYVAGIVLALGAGGFTRYLLSSQAVSWLLPAIFLSTIGATTYAFGAGMVLFEKNERTLNALSVSPLPPRVYVLSKVVSLAGFATIECAIMLLLSNGGAVFKTPLMLAATLCMGALLALFGIGQVVSYDSITDFLVPWGIVAIVVIQLPLLDWLNVWPHPVWYVVPTQAQLVLMKAAREPIEIWEWIYGLGYTALALLAAYAFAIHRFRGYILGR